MPKATVAIEDRRFYQHNGSTPRASPRALEERQRGQVVEGGSTITQQLVRNLYIGREQHGRAEAEGGLPRDQARQGLAKNRILATYMNQVYYGNLGYGIEAAAQTYFSKHASELNLPRPRCSPDCRRRRADYNPFRSTESRRARRNQVLQALLDEGDITRRSTTGRSARARPQGRASSTRRSASPTSSATSATS
jgi:penicillin-binding protein 1A